MKKSFFYLLILFISIIFFCCSQEKPGDNKILARINNYDLSLYEFQYELASELKLDKDFKLTSEAKKEFLALLIRKEILIQEAKKLELDRKQNFIKTIERYWKATLIRDLLDLKGKEINKTIVVSQEEVETYYRKMQESDKDLPPFENVQENITNELTEKRRIAALKAWIDVLRENANIEINQELLANK